MDAHPAEPTRIASARCGSNWRRPVLAIIALAALVCSTPGELSAAVVTVSIKDYAFDPQVVNADVGDTVVWTNNDGIAHTVTSDSGAWTQLAIGPSGSGQLTFAVGGDYPYHCALHAQLESGTIHVQGPTPAVITSAPPWDGVLNMPYAYTLTASGSATISYALTAGSLPPGLTVSSAGVISGTPVADGVFAGDISAANSLSPSSIQHFSITVGDFATAPTIVSGQPPAGTAGVTYRHTYSATGSGPITYTVSFGALPDGVTLSPTGVLSGIPTTSSTFAYTGTVTASNGTAPDSSQTFNILIAANPNGGGGGGGGGYVPPGKDCGSGAKVVLLLLSGLVLLRRFA